MAEAGGTGVLLVRNSLGAAPNSPVLEDAEVFAQAQAVFQVNQQFVATVMRASAP